jgi:hypothetical protein
MVRGIAKFKEYFTGYEDNYIIIGGTACDILEETAGQEPRATKDIDIILIVEALTPEFVKQFWEFVKAGEYETRQNGKGKNEYFRFLKPHAEEFPLQVELFSRKPDVLNIPTEAHLTPIPIDEDLSSLSAILMNDDYYQFAMEHSTVDNGVRLANIESLIALKAKAFLDLSKRRTKEEAIDEKNIKKHKNDIFRLATMLNETDNFLLPDDLFLDLAVFSEDIKKSLPDESFFSKTIGIPNIKPMDVFVQLCNAFNIEWENENTVHL